MSWRNPHGIAVENADHQRRIRRHLDDDRAVGLDRRIADDLFHAEETGHAKRRVVDVERVFVGYRHGLFDAQEARRALVGQRLRGIGQHVRIDAGR